MPGTVTPPTGTDSSGFAGQLRPEDSNSDANVFWFMLRQKLGTMDFATYCSVMAVYGGGLAGPATVDVLPLVNLLDGQGNAQQQAVVHGLPVYRYQGGLNAVICDPLVGDIGKVICCDRDMTSVINSNTSVSAGSGSPKQANPGSYRRLSLCDGTFFPCVLGAQPTQYIWFKSDGIYLEDKNGNSITCNGTGISIQDFNGNKFTMTSAGIILTDKSGNKADLTAGSGEITINTHTLTQHKHFVNAVQSGGSSIDSQTPTG